MAYSRRKTKKDGTIFYEITATKNRNEKVSKSWTPPPGWSQKSIERQLHKEEAEFQRQFDAGEILTVAEKREKERLEALERAKLVTFKDFSESVYLPEIILNQTENTRISYENALKTWVYPEFGEMKLVDINGAMVRALLTKMQTAGRGVSSRRIALTIIRGVLARAVESGLICDNCAAGVPLTKSKAEKTAAKKQGESFLTSADVQAIFAYIDKNESLHWRTLFHALFDTGCRRCELVALRWSDIDFSSGRIVVDKSLNVSPNLGRYEAPPKSGHSRTAFVSPATLGLLKQWRHEQSTLCLSPYIFTNGGPEPIQATAINYRCKKISQAVGVTFHPHSLRHAAATLSLQGGADLGSVSAMLGHSNVAITAGVYIHPDESRVQKAAQAAWAQAAAAGEK